MANRQVHVVGVNADGTPYDGYMTEVDICPTSSKHTWKPWHDCARCGIIGSENELVRKGGRFYCSICAPEVK